MAKRDGPVVIKKYANRRLYNTGTSTYVTLDELSAMVKRGEDFTVTDAKSGQDITHSVLTQIIFELENKTGQSMLPIPFLRQLIAYYGDSMQMFLPSYLEQSMRNFAARQEQLRDQMRHAIGSGNPVEMASVGQKVMSEQAQRNMEMFQQAMRMFNPFLAGTIAHGSTGAHGGNGTSSESHAAKGGDLEEMRREIAQMQERLDKLGSS